VGPQTQVNGSASGQAASIHGQSGLAGLGRALPASTLIHQDRHHLGLADIQMIRPAGGILARRKPGQRRSPCTRDRSWRTRSCTSPAGQLLWRSGPIGLSLVRCHRQEPHPSISVSIDPAMGLHVQNSRGGPLRKVGFGCQPRKAHDASKTTSVLAQIPPQALRLPDHQAATMA
jgi:hypothetical protein